MAIKKLYYGTYNSSSIARVKIIEIDMQLNTNFSYVFYGHNIVNSKLFSIYVTAQKCDLIYFHFVGHACLCGKDEVILTKINTNYIH